MRLRSSRARSRSPRRASAVGGARVKSRSRSPIDDKREMTDVDRREMYNACRKTYNDILRQDEWKLKIYDADTVAAAAADTDVPRKRVSAPAATAAAASSLPRSSSSEPLLKASSSSSSTESLPVVARKHNVWTNAEFEWVMALPSSPTQRDIVKRDRLDAKLPLHSPTARPRVPDLVHYGPTKWRCYTISSVDNLDRHIGLGYHYRHKLVLTQELWDNLTEWVEIMQEEYGYTTRWPYASLARQYAMFTGVRDETKTMAGISIELVPPKAMQGQYFWAMWRIGMPIALATTADSATAASASATATATAASASATTITATTTAAATRDTTAATTDTATDADATTDAATILDAPTILARPFPIGAGVSRRTRLRHRFGLATDDAASATATDADADADATTQPGPARRPPTHRVARIYARLAAQIRSTQEAYLKKRGC